ncbi:membrane fusion protein, cobalt-zinc-cadmium efflux system [Nonlabens sp. Hel1_33_55]|uniref:efflux RND transporter periplasmic adaptor subunit n=1 Tax=Nonlabens sp. Hel1_33_55 TaxID=1336802 RepID=UPI000875C415|nr:efflux RND transporter periplasmic adaptor subunit [Nonlabens sp. Hel1_33_55]SCY18812.1 membrane fusion protein, cobalt-zinc-cadmium efflux system [Nonlabens sp. Hel1_33_55]
MKTIKYIPITAMLLVLLLTSCGDTKSADDETIESAQTEENLSTGENEEVMLTAQQYEALVMKIDTLSQRNMSGYVEANGQLEVPPQNEASITAISGANVVSIEVIEGDKVMKNQVVAYLSHPSIIQIQSDYLNAYSNSRFLKQEFERQKRLYEAGVASGMNYQKATADYQASTAMVNGLEAQLRQYNINVSGVRNGTIYQRVPLRSPIEGFVQKVEVKTGQYVEPQTDLFEIVDTHHVHADLMVFEKDVDKVKKGQQVRFSVQSRPGMELIAEIYSVGQTFEQEPKAIHVHAEIENKEGDLIPGMYIQGRIQEENVETTAMPESAIAVDGDKSYVFSAQREGDDWSFVPMEVTTGEKDGDWIAIQFLKTPEANTQFAYNNAYYLMAEMQKGEAEHSH